jgi:endonuclease YncB( thermonuclease family)
LRSALAAPLLLFVPLFVSHAHPGRVNPQGCHQDAAAAKRHCHAERAVAPQKSERVAAPRAGEEGVFDGAIAWITDGDTIHALVKGRDMEVRLADVDAPERDQPHGWASKLQLLDLVRGKHVVLEPRDVDRYGRVVAKVWVGDLDVNRELVKRGAAWFYPEYAEDETLYYDEQRARAATLGLWSLPADQRVEPWEWRRRKRAEEEAHAPAKRARRAQPEEWPSEPSVAPLPTP